MTIRTKTVFITEDGEEFTSKEIAQVHQREVSLDENKIKYNATFTGTKSEGYFYNDVVFISLNIHPDKYKESFHSHKITNLWGEIRNIEDIYNQGSYEGSWISPVETYDAIKDINEYVEIGKGLFLYMITYSWG